MPNNEPISIILIEDNREYRDVIDLALADIPDLNLVESFATCEIALRHIQSASNRAPQIILLDLRLPGMKGLEAIPYIQSYTPKSKIIVLTQSDNEEDVLTAIGKGAAGYLLKSASITEITEGIRTVASGGASLDPSVAKFILQSLKTRLPAQANCIELSKREQEILALLGEGLVKKEIADKLDIGYSTVDTHVSHIYEKLQVRNAPSAIARAYRIGIFKNES